MTHLNRRQVPGWPGYAYTVDGKLWSCKTYHNLTGWREIGVGQDRNGYFKCHLSHGKRRWGTHVHAVIAFATLGPRPEGLEVDHINHICTDNRPENLQYLTRQEQMVHTRGDGNVQCKIVDADLPYVFQLRALGLFHSEIAAILQVSRRHIGAILNREERAA